MHAAIVTSFDRPPRYGECPAPSGELVADVLAAGLHPRVRAGANGTHYTSEGTLPMVPGVDGVGRTADGELVYFVADGSFAEQVALDPCRVIPLPADADPVLVAAAMNPAMSSWVALRRRVSFQPGQSVLILGATGNAGRLAVEIARHLGAAQVIAVGRNLDALAGADATAVSLGDAEAVGEAAADVDVVIDYVWGSPAEAIIPALLTRRRERSQALDWIQIGSMGGAEITLPSFVLRAANLRIMGSGQGSLSTAGIVAELPSLIEVLPKLHVDATAVPLREVESAWSRPERIVFVL